MDWGESARIKRPAAWTFAAVVAIAFPLYMVLARKQWFFQDEWEFLANRDGGSWNSLMQSHNEHWSTLPVIAYRILFHVFGLETYKPYQALAVAAHLTVAVLLRVVMRRAGVHPWLATAAATAFALFGAGYQDIVWGFQIGYVAPIALCLVQLILTGHDGPVGRRDVLGLAFGFLALLCSGTAVTMIAVVGIAVLIRRGLRPALVQVVPLATIFLAWWSAYGREDSPKRDSATVGELLSFVGRGIASVPSSLAQNPVLAVVLVAVTAVGLVVAVLSPPPDWRARWAAPLALAVGSFVFFAITAVGRAGGEVVDAEKSRYVHVGLALVLPGAAVALDALARRWHVLLVPLCVLLVLGVPANLGEVHEQTKSRFEGAKRGVLVLARSTAIEDLPSNFRPFGRAERHITVGWLRDGVEAGRIPAPFGGISKQEQADAYSVIALVGPTRQADEPCRPRKGSSRGTMEPGDRFRFRGALVFTTRKPGASTDSSRRTMRSDVTGAVAVRAPVRIDVERGTLCR